MKLVRLACIFMVLIPTFIFAEGRQAMPDYMKPQITVLSISSDGQYAISTDGYQHAVLWNLKKHTSKIVATGVNIYSAYFVKHTHDYMYQLNNNNEVVVRNVQGGIVKQFNPGYASYGNILFQSLSEYIGSDIEFNVVKLLLNSNKKIRLNTSYCFQDHKGMPYRGPGLSACTGFMSAGKLLNLTLSPDESFLVGSGDSGLYFWNFKSKQSRLIIKNSGQTFARQLLHHGYHGQMHLWIQFVFWKLLMEKCEYDIVF